jgi:hypothetical protein
LCRNVALVVRRQQQKLAALTLVGAGVTDVGRGTLPEVVDHPSGRARWNLDDDWSVAPKVDIAHSVDRRAVRGVEEALGVGEIIPDCNVIVVDAEIALHALPETLERHRGYGPKIGLHGALEVHLVEQALGRRLGWIAILELQLAEAGIGCLGLRACEWR